MWSIFIILTGKKEKKKNIKKKKVKSGRALGWALWKKSSSPLLQILVKSCPRNKRRKYVYQVHYILILAEATRLYYYR